MDFKFRLNSCGRFTTDENFKKIIMRNSCRLRQNSVASQNEGYKTTENSSEINNISIIKKKSKKKHYLKKKEGEKKEKKDKSEEILSTKKENKKDKKYLRHISDLSDKNHNNKNKSSSLNQLFFYQDIKSIKINKIIKKVNNEVNLDNENKNNDENNYSTEVKEKKTKESNIVDNSEGEIKKSFTINNHSTKKRRNFLLKKLKNEINKNAAVHNDIKKKIHSNNLHEKKITNNLLNNSFFTNNKNSSINDIYSTEKNKTKNNLNHQIIKENNKLYKKPKNINHVRNKYIHNSTSLFPVTINKIEQNVNNKVEQNITNDDKNEEKIIDNNNDKNIEDLTNEETIITDEFINNFFCELIDLSNGMEEKSIFDILVNNLNKKYIINYKNISFPKSNLRFSYCFKYFCTLITPLLFLSKDDDLYKYDSIKGHLFINQFIFSALWYIGQNNFDMTKIQNFIKKYGGSKKVPMIHSTSSFIKLIFGEKQEYEPLKSALIQLVKNVLNETVDNMIKILSDTILFCFNNKPKERLCYPFCIKKSQKKCEENSKISESSPSAPFIKSSMKKEFCLVLDIDETISHTLKLPFGYYFLLRPGTIDLLNELSNYYEIDIFTSSLKLYADFILDRIDVYGNLISYRLYKHHVTYEKGKSVKNLNKIGRDINKIIFVDNLKSNAKYNLKNLCHISSWKNDIYDNELIKLKNKLKYIATSGKYNDDITKGIN